MASSQPISAMVLTLSGLFCDDNRFRLPHFQRAYAWGTDQLTRLLTDLLEASRRSEPRRRHFLGRLLLARPGGGDSVSVIDGHQRLMTLTILFAVLRDLAEDADERQRMSKLIAATLARGEVEQPSVRLLPHAGLAPFLSQYVQTEGATRVAYDGDPMELSETEANVVANRDYLRSELTAIEDSGRMRQELAQFLCERCQVEVLEVEDELEAWSMLQTEEQTRLDFNATDRAKASILSAMPAGDRSICGPIWESWESRLGAADMRALLGHIRTLQMRRRTDVPVETELIQAFDLHKNAPVFFERTLVPAAERFVALRSPGSWLPADREGIVASLETTGWIDRQIWVPTALQWLDKNGAHDPNTHLFFARIERLVWLLRLAGIDPLVQQTRFLKLLAEIDGGVAVATSPSLAVEPKLLSAAVANLRSRTFYSKHYCGAVLGRISVALGADPAALDRQSFTIEHVLPRNPPPRRDWWRKFGNKERINAFANRIGNLTLLSPAENQLTAAREYDEKRAVLIGSAYHLARHAGLAEDWTPAEIERRSQAMIEMLLAAWGLKSPS